jgi:hypothetical protein
VVFAKEVTVILNRFFNAINWTPPILPLARGGAVGGGVNLSQTFIKLVSDPWAWSADCLSQVENYSLHTIGECQGPESLWLLHLVPLSPGPPIGDGGARAGHDSSAADSHQ